jgi:hypothetical protein
MSLLMEIDEVDLHEEGKAGMGDAESWRSRKTL